MTRKDYEEMTSNELRERVEEKHGLRKANILINEASYKIVKSQLTLDVIFDIQKEAAIRVLAGQTDGKQILIKDQLL